MNKFIKTIVVVSLSLMTFVLVVVAFIFYKLPSAHDLSSGMRQSTKKINHSEASLNNTEVKSSVDSSVQPAESAADSGEEKASLQTKILKDLTDSDKPLSNFCASLKNASSEVFTTEGFAKAFEKSADSENADPRIQAMKPFFRYILKLPSMKQLISEVEDAKTSRTLDSVYNKARFYSLAYTAMGEMKDHHVDIESVLDRAYLLIELNNLVALRPELLNDSKVQNFCNSTETLFNQSVAVDFVNEKKDFQMLLANLEVKPSEIAFDENYKTKLDMGIKSQALVVNGGWIEDLFVSESAEESADEVLEEKAQGPSSKKE
ncbi:MAG: hypothetical protein WA160_04700 [Pseudobdellovibrio sp.]